MTSMYDPAHPGKTIRDAIEAKGWTLAESANRLGVPRKTLLHVLNGEASARAGTGAPRLERRRPLGADARCLRLGAVPQNRVGGLRPDFILTTSPPRAIYCWTQLQKLQTLHYPRCNRKERSIRHASSNHSWHRCCCCECYRRRCYDTKCQRQNQKRKRTLRASSQRVQKCRAAL